MDDKYIPKLTMLTAAAITCIMCIITKRDTTFSLAVLLGVMVVFLVLGHIARKIVLSVRKSAEDAEESDDEEEKNVDGDKDGLKDEDEAETS